jgi:hypothetical protein
LSQKRRKEKQNALLKQRTGIGGDRYFCAASERKPVSFEYIKNYFELGKVFGLLLLVTCFSSCYKDPGSSFPLDGTYSGVYLSTGEIQDTGSVRLAFAGLGFSGESMGTARTICYGNYQISADSINFTNLCSTPDPQLLLVGKYRMVTTGDSLYFTRTISGTLNYEEHFDLKKQ